MHPPRWNKDTIGTFNDLARLPIVGWHFLLVHRVLVHCVVRFALSVKIFGRQGTFFAQLFQYSLECRCGWGPLQLPRCTLFKGLSSAFDVIPCITYDVFEASADKSREFFVELVDTFLPVTVNDTFVQVR